MSWISTEMTQLLRIQVSLSPHLIYTSCYIHIYRKWKIQWPVDLSLGSVKEHLAAIYVNPGAMVIIFWHPKTPIRAPLDPNLEGGAQQWPYDPQILEPGAFTTLWRSILLSQTKDLFLNHGIKKGYIEKKKGSNLALVRRAYVCKNHKLHTKEHGVFYASPSRSHTWGHSSYSHAIFFLPVHVTEWGCVCGDGQATVFFLILIFPNRHKCDQGSWVRPCTIMPLLQLIGAFN